MTLTEAILATAFFPAHKDEARARMIADLVTGKSTFCDTCQFPMQVGEVCTICENEWADQEYARFADAEDARFGCDAFARF